MERKEIEHKIYESIGEASMCWSEIPKGVFDDVEANRIGLELMTLVDKLIAEKEQLLQAMTGIYNMCDGDNPTHENIWRLAHDILH